MKNKENKLNNLDTWDLGEKEGRKSMTMTIITMFMKSTMRVQIIQGKEQRDDTLKSSEVRKTTKKKKTSRKRRDIVIDDKV